MYFCLRTFLESLQLFFHVVYPFGFSVMFSPFPYFATNFFHPVVGMSSCILPLIAGRIFFRYFGMSYFVCIVFVLSRYLFILPSFDSTF